MVPPLVVGLIVGIIIVFALGLASGATAIGVHLADLCGLRTPVRDSGARRADEWVVDEPFAGWRRRFETPEPAKLDTSADVDGGEVGSP